MLVREGDTTRVGVRLGRAAVTLNPVLTEARDDAREAFVSIPNVAPLSITARAIDAVPRLGEADVIRVVQLLPGVHARNDFSTSFNVRGGEADQNLILIDGYPIHNPFHVGGLFSTFIESTVRDVSLHTGGFPARFGGRLSSVLDVRSAVESRPGVHGSADVSALGATAQLGGAFMEQRGTWTAAVRRTYADRVIDAFSDNVFPYHFRDLHAHAAYAFPNDVRIAVTAYAGKDIVDADYAEFAADSGETRASWGELQFSWGNEVVGATISKTFATGSQAPVVSALLGDRATIEQRISRSSFSTTFDQGAGSFREVGLVRETRLAGALTAQAAAHDWSLGYDLAWHRTRHEMGSPQVQTRALARAQDGASFSAYVEDTWRVSPRWLLGGGMRVETLSERAWAGISPRLSVKYFLDPELAITISTGRFTQWMHSNALEEGPIRLFDLWTASDDVTPVTSAWHYQVGGEKWFTATRYLRLEGYFKQYDRLLEPNRAESPSLRGDEFTTVRGDAYGFDVMLKDIGTGRTSGWISYSYGVTARERNGVRYFPGQDRRHNVNAVGRTQLGKFVLGARFAFASGTPFTEMVGEIVRRVYDPWRDAWGTGGGERDAEYVGGPLDGGRLPPSQRLDLNVSRDFRVRRATVSPFISVVNAYNAQNVFIYDYEFHHDPPTRRAISQLPIVPSIGVHIAF
jgi:hypothetical protein